MLVFPEIVRELEAILELDEYANFRVKRVEYLYIYNVFHLYYDSLVSEREAVERWAKLLYPDQSFVFAEYRLYNAVRRDTGGLVHHINPVTQRDFLTPQQIADYIETQDDDRSIIGSCKIKGVRYYGHREDYAANMTIRRTLGEVIAKKSDALANIKFTIAPDSLLTPSQRDIINYVSEHNLTIATGGAGTGKTTVILEIIKSYLRSRRSDSQQSSGDIDSIVDSAIGTASHLHRGLFILTPTHMAANNIRTRLRRIFSAQEMDLIYINTILRFSRDFRSHPSGSLIIFEESSMFDNVLSQIIKLNSGNFYDCKYLFVGDPNQLPPPSRSSILQFIINQFTTHHLALRENHRSGDIIVKNAERLIFFKSAPSVSFDTTSNFTIESASSLERLQIDNYYKRIMDAANSSQSTVDDIMFITHRNVDVLAINRVLRDQYFAAKDIEIDDDVVANSRTYPLYHSSKSMGAWEWRVGDRARCKINTPHIYNGSICTVRGFVDENILVEYCGRINAIRYTKLWPAYCITVHNSQGQEWDHVVFCDLSQRALQPPLLYVGITRAKKQVIIARILPDDVVTVADFELDNGTKEAYYEEAVALT